jgi:hypothetical protein
MLRLQGLTRTSPPGNNARQQELENFHTARSRKFDGSVRFFWQVRVYLTETIQWEGE